MVDVSVVIASWNAKDCLAHCLSSIREKAAGIRMEVIVVDNGSTDGTPDRVRGGFPGVRLVENGANLGFAKACNIGIRAASGRYLCLMNSDVVLRDDCLPCLLAYMESHPAAGMCGPRMLGPAGEWRRSTMGFPTIANTLSRALALDSLFPSSRLLGGYLMAWGPRDRAREVDVLNGWFWLIRRSALESVGLLDEGFFIYAEDIDLCRRFADAGLPRVYVPAAAAVHLGGMSSARQPVRFFLEMQRANLRYWRKHAGRVGARAYVLVLALHHLVRLLGYALASAAGRGAPAESRYKLRRSLTALRALSAEA